MAAGDNEDTSTKLMQYKMLISTMDIYMNTLQTAIMQHGKKL